MCYHLVSLTLVPGSVDFLAEELVITYCSNIAYYDQEGKAVAYYRVHVAVADSLYRIDPICLFY